MARKAEELYREALALSVEEREELMRLLLMQADNGWASPKIEQAWIEEADRRMKAVKEGREKLIPGEEVMRELREIVAK